MVFLESILKAIMASLPQTLLALTGLMLIALLLFLLILLRLNRLSRRYDMLMRGMEGKNIEQMLLAQLEEVRRLGEDVKRLAAQTARLEDKAQSCVQRFGIVRFNAFDDTGSDLSFAVALLNAQNDGVVISSIYGRSESRTYAKPIKGGESKYLLSDEEKQALAIAQGRGK